MIITLHKYNMMNKNFKPVTQGQLYIKKTYDTNPSRELTCLTSLKGKMHLPKPLWKGNRCTSSTNPCLHVNRPPTLGSKLYPSSIQINQKMPSAPATCFLVDTLHVAAFGEDVVFNFWGEDEKHIAPCLARRITKWNDVFSREDQIKHKLGHQSIQNSRACKASSSFSLYWIINFQRKRAFSESVELHVGQIGFPNGNTPTKEYPNTPETETLGFTSRQFVLPQKSVPQLIGIFDFWCSNLDWSCCMVILLFLDVFFFWRIFTCSLHLYLRLRGQSFSPIGENLWRYDMILP